MGVYRVALSSKGQVVLPADLRRRWRVERGAQLLLVEEGDRAYLSPSSFEEIYALRGRYKNAKPSLTSILRGDKKEQRKRERRLIATYAKLRSRR